MTLNKWQEDYLVVCVGCRVSLVTLSSTIISCFCDHHGHPKYPNGFCTLGYLSLKVYTSNMLSAYDIKCQIPHCLRAMIYCFLWFSACDMSSSLPANKENFVIQLKSFDFVICVNSFVLTPFLWVCFKLSYLVLEVPFQFHLWFFIIKIILPKKK